MCVSVCEVLLYMPSSMTFQIIKSCQHLCLLTKSVFLLRNREIPQPNNNSFLIAEFVNLTVCFVQNNIKELVRHCSSAYQSNGMSAARSGDLTEVCRYVVQEAATVVLLLIQIM